LTRLGVTEEPLKSTIDSLLKLLPLMVNTNVLPPAVVVLGEIEAIDGVAGQEQDTTVVASAITSTYKTDDLAAFATGVHRRRTGSDKRGAGKLSAIQEDRRDHRDLTTGPPQTNIIRLTRFPASVPKD
jgi:hypothetical protein